MTTIYRVDLSIKRQTLHKTFVSEDICLHLCTGGAISPQSVRTLTLDHVNRVLPHQTTAILDRLVCDVPEQRMRSVINCTKPVSSYINKTLVGFNRKQSFLNENGSKLDGRSYACG